MGVAILGGQALSHLAKLGFSRPRPDLVPHGVEVATTSFPSGHSMMAAVTYLTLAVMLARSERHLSIRAFYISVAAILAMLVGVSRVYLGVHWPSDVLAGWTLGAAWALGVWLLARQMGRKGQIEPDRRGES
jgi:undecaprenyl-diphosphatase